MEGLAKRLKLKLYRTCVKEDVNVTEVFAYLSELQQRKAAMGLAAQVAAAPPAGTSGGVSMGQQHHESGYGDEVPEEPRPEAPRARTVDLKPSKKRTGGKKQFSDKFSSCSIL